MTSLDTSRPVLLLGGGASTLAAARSLGAAGIPVIASGTDGCRAMKSRYCAGARPISVNADPQVYWRRLLIEAPDPELAGSVILVGCDESLEFVEKNHEALRQYYVIEDFVPELRHAMLDKLKTLELARTAGVPTPNFWPIDTVDDVFAIGREITFPVMVKPLSSYPFIEEFGCKLFIVTDSFDEVVEKVALCNSRGK